MGTVYEYSRGACILELISNNEGIDLLIGVRKNVLNYNIIKTTRSTRRYNLY
jgi:hypothetical protein